MPSSAWAPSPAAYGRRAERLAAWWLWLHGFRVRRNVHVGGRQVDLVGRRGRLLVICEVKARRHFEHPLEGIGAQQRRRLREAAEMLAERDPGVRQVRMDVIGVCGWRPRLYPGVLDWED